MDGHGLRSTPRQERSTHSVETILDVAHQLVTADGSAALTVGRVATAAGISPGKVYYWFQDKHALLEALRLRAHETFEEFLRNTLDFVEIDDAAGLIENYATQFASYMIANPTDLALLDRHRSDTRPLRDLMTDLTVPLLSARVTGITTAEAHLVAKNLVTILIALTTDILDASPRHRKAMTTEMVYVLYAYLHSRYPHADDQVWTNPTHPLQPARPVTGHPRSRQLRPADIPEKG